MIAQAVAPASETKRSVGMRSIGFGRVFQCGWRLPLGLCLIVVGVAALAPAAAAEEAAEQEQGWISLFNGENLDGWRVKIRGYELDDNFGNTFRVEDGLLKVVYDEYEEFGDRFGHIFYEQPFSHYLLRVEYRFVGEQVPGGPGWAFRNNGLMLHGQSPESMGLDQSFPVSIEVQLLGGDGENERSNANLCSPGTHVVMNGELITQHCTESSSKTYHGDQWVTVEVEVRGNKRIRHMLDGEVVLEYTEPQLDPNHEDAKPLIQDGEVMLHGGTISLQAESHPTEFRKIELLPLDPEDTLE